MQTPPPFEPVSRVLLGPGPSALEPSVLAALSKPPLSHLDPRFLRVLDEISEMLRAVFETQNPLTLAISGTGSAGMEAALQNLIEPGDPVLVGVAGVFGGRLSDVARRAGADVTELKGPWGRALSADALRECAAGRRFKLVCIVHAETSTGVLQPLEPVRSLADELGALLVVDAVTSLGGLPVSVDARRLDVVYSGAQKCLSSACGLAPLTLSAAAEQALKARTRPVQSFYVDLEALRRYWGPERIYHHTAPSHVYFALHEALRLALAEGLEARFARHRLNGRALWSGLEALGLELIVNEAERLPMLTTLRVPEGIDEASVRSFLLERHSLEIGAGLGPMKGNAWRIGLMGAGSTRQNVLFCLDALRSALSAQGFRPKGDPLAAADACYAR